MTWGARAYGYAAHNLAMSIRHHSPSIPVTIYCDAETRKGLRDLSLFDQVIEIPSQVHDPALMKMQVYDRLPYQETIFMDVDGLLLKPLEPLFDELSQGGEYRCHVHDWYDKDSPDNLPQMYWATKSVIWQHYGFTNEKLPATQSSFQYIRKSAFCKELFDRMQSNYANRIPLERLANKWGGGQPDELYLNITLAQMGYDPSLNTVCYWGNALDAAWADVKRDYYVLSMFGTAQNIKKPYVMGYDGMLSSMGGKPYRWDVISGHKIANKKTSARAANDGLGRDAFTKRFFKVSQMSDTSDIKGSVYLFMSYFNTGNPSRQAELDECMRHNIADTNITKIYNLGQPYNHPKVVNLDYDYPTYQDFVEEANLAGGDYSIIANSDIYFDDTIKWIDKVDLTGTMLALSRYDMKGGKPVLFAYAHSQDTWIFKGRIDLKGLNYQMGKPGCDNRLAYDAMLQGYKVLNPAKDIRTYHLHESNVRNYNESDRLIGGYQPVYISSIMDAGKLRRLLIVQPGKVGDIIICLPIAKWYADRGYSVEWMCPKQYHHLFTYVDYCHPVERASGFYDKTIDISFGLNHRSPSHRMWESRRGSLDSFVTLKYEIAGVPVSEAFNLKYNRNEQKEKELFKTLGLEGVDYAVAHGSSDYGSEPVIDTVYRRVDFKPVSGYSIFDWYKVLENAKEIHCIDSSLLNFADRVDTNAKRYYHITDRVPNKSDRTLLSKQWEEVNHVVSV